MKTNSEYLLRTVAGEYLLVPTGSAAQRLNGMIHLTETAAFIWKQVDQAKDLSEIISKMLDEYDIDVETAKKDVNGFLHEMYIRNMVKDIPEFQKLAE